MATRTDSGAASDWMKSYRFGLRVTEQGTLVSIGDGVAQISGLPSGPPSIVGVSKEAEGEFT